MSDLRPVVDHVLINVDAALDAAVQSYRALGFSLTERGHHSIGSSNHLAILGDDYIELLGYEPQNAARAAGLWGAHHGLAGLIFKTTDAEALADHLHGAGIATMTPRPTPLSRPVELPDGTAPVARFSTLHIDPQLTPSGRIFFCQHHTPELVWRPEWQSHPNAADGILSVTFAAKDPAQAAKLVAQIYPEAVLEPVEGGLRLQAGKAELLWLTPEAVFARYGDAAPALGADDEVRKVALGLHSASLDQTADLLRTNQIPFHQQAGQILVPHRHAAGLALSFSA